MDGFTIIDAVVAAVIVLSAILAYSRGLVREIMAIVGWVGAAVVAFIFAPQVEPLIKQVPGLAGFIGDSCEISIVMAFAAVFALALVILSLFTPLLSSFVRGSALGGLDQGFGLIFGVARGILLVAVAFFVYHAVFSEPVAVVDTSRSAAVFENMATKLQERDPTQALGWLIGRYDQLVGTCGTPQ